MPPVSADPFRGNQACPHLAPRCGICLQTTASLAARVWTPVTTGITQADESVNSGGHSGARRYYRLSTNRGPVQRPTFIEGEVQCERAKGIGSRGSDFAFERWTFSLGTISGLWSASAWHACGQITDQQTYGQDPQLARRVVRGKSPSNARARIHPVVIYPYAADTTTPTRRAVP